VVLRDVEPAAAPSFNMTAVPGVEPVPVVEPMPAFDTAPAADPMPAVEPFPAPAPTTAQETQAMPISAVFEDEVPASGFVQSVTLGEVASPDIPGEVKLVDPSEFTLPGLRHLGEREDDMDIEEID